MTVAKNVLNRIHVQRLLLAVALLGFSLSASAASTFPGFMAKVSGRGTTVGAASDGTLIVTKGSGLTAGGGWTNAGNYGVAPGAAGAVKIGGGGTVSAGGKFVPVEIGGSLTKDVIAGAVGGCLSGTIVGCAIGIGTPLALAWAGTAGLRIGETSGVPELKDPKICTVAPCYQFQVDIGSGGPWASTKDEACEAAISMIADAWSGRTVSNPRVSTNGALCWYTVKNPSGSVYVDPAAQPFRQRPATPGSPTWNPATPKEVKDALIAAPFPSPMMVPELEKAGVDWNKRWPGYDTGTDGKMGSPKIVGPAEILGDKTTTTNPDGSKTVKQSRTPMTYEDGKVTAGPTTTTETTTNADGTPREKATTVTEPGDEAAKPEEPPKDPCEGHAERLGCIDINVPEGKIPRENKEVSFQSEDVLGAGACPANVNASFTTLGGQSATIIDWQTFCGQALPLRALVMGLAAIMAFFIIMPGGVRE